MGAWGPAIFSDDTACDVRDDYRELIEDGVEDDIAFERTVANYQGAIDDPDDGPVFWLALALTQSKIGRLREDVKRRAIQVIDSGADLARWDDPTTRRKRQAALAKARTTLEGPQPARKRLRPPSKHETSLQAGDVLSLSLDGGLRLLRVARIDDHRTSLAPILVALDFDGTELPSERRLRHLKDRAVAGRRADPDTGLLPPWHNTTFRVIVHKKVDFGDAGFAVVGNMPRRAGDESINAQSYSTWAQLVPVLRRTLERP